MFLLVKPYILTPFHLVELNPYQSVWQQCGLPLPSAYQPRARFKRSDSECNATQIACRSLYNSSLTCGFAFSAVPSLHVLSVPSFLLNNATRLNHVCEVLRVRSGV
jgi:hypothetical protein